MVQKTEVKSKLVSQRVLVIRSAKHIPYLCFCEGNRGRVVEIHCPPLITMDEANKVNLVHVKVIW